MHVCEEAVKKLKAVSLELGGKSPSLLSFGCASSRLCTCCGCISEVCFVPWQTYSPG